MVARAERGVRRQTDKGRELPYVVFILTFFFLQNSGPTDGRRAHMCVCVDLLFRSVDEPMRRHSAQIGGAFLTAVRMGARDLFVGPTCLQSELPAIFEL